MTSRTWYRIALARPAAPPMVVVAPGAHLGEAISNGVRHVGRGAWAAAVALADATEVPLGEAFGKHDVVERGPDAAIATGLRWPLGIVPSFGDAARAATLREGFGRRALGGDPAGTVVEAVADGPRTDEVFLSIVERLPAADNVEIKVLHTYDSAGSTDVWLSPRLDVKKTIRLLDDHDVELLHNGHIELSIYLRAQKATLGSASTRRSRGCARTPRWPIGRRAGCARRGSRSCRRWRRSRTWATSTGARRRPARGGGWSSGSRSWGCGRSTRGSRRS